MKELREWHTFIWCEAGGLITGQACFLAGRLNSLLLLHVLSAVTASTIGVPLVLQSSSQAQVERRGPVWVEGPRPRALSHPRALLCLLSAAFQHFLPKVYLKSQTLLMRAGRFLASSPSSYMSPQLCLCVLRPVSLCKCPHSESEDHRPAHH